MVGKGQVGGVLEVFCQHLIAIGQLPIIWLQPATLANFQWIFIFLNRIN